jgi:hypothetical protein
MKIFDILLPPNFRLPCPLITDPGSVAKSIFLSQETRYFFLSKQGETIPGIGKIIPETNNYFLMAQ